MTGWKNLTTNVILYCKNWEKTVDFYKNRLSLQVSFINSWFVEFYLTETSRLSIANEQKTSVKSPDKKGITIALQVEDINAAWKTAVERKLDPTEIKPHPWNASVFYIFDPEGHRIEIWQIERYL